MRRRIVSAAFAVLVTLAASVSARAQSSAPVDSGSVSRPQPVAGANTVPTLTNFSSFATIMNLARGTVRLVAVVSPSSPDAETGLGVLTSVLEDIPSKRLRAYVVLSAAADDDSGARAVGFAARHRNPRIVYIWDPESSVAAAMGPVAGVGDAFAFGTYYLFDTDATFTETPASPVMWMQLSPYIDGAPLEAAPLREKAETLVRAVEKKAAEASSGQ